MADPETPQAQPPEAPKRQRPSGGNSSRPDRPQSSNLFWWLVLGGVFVALVISVFGNRDRAEELKLSEFMAGLQASEEEPDSSRSRFNRTNVHNLVIGSDYIRFQDQPKKLDEQSSENARAVKYYRIPAFGMTDDKAELTRLLNGFAEALKEWRDDTASQAHKPGKAAERSQGQGAPVPPPAGDDDGPF